MNLDINSGVTKYGRQFALFYKAFNMNNTFKIIIFCLPFYFVYQSYAASYVADGQNIFHVVNWEDTLLFLDVSDHPAVKPVSFLNAPVRPAKQSDHPLLELIEKGDFENFLKKQTKSTCLQLTNDGRTLLGVAAFLGKLEFLQSMYLHENLFASYRDRHGKTALDYAYEGRAAYAALYPWQSPAKVVAPAPCSKGYEDCISFLIEKEKHDKIKKRSIKNK